MKLAVAKQILHVLQSVRPINACNICTEGIGECGFCGAREYNSHSNNCELTQAINGVKSYIKAYEATLGIKPTKD